MLWKEKQKNMFITFQSIVIYHSWRRQALLKDPTRRPSAQQLLGHRWLANREPYAWKLGGDAPALPSAAPMLAPATPPRCSVAAPGAP